MPTLMASPINAAQSTFTINRETDQIWKSAAKVVARIPTNTALGLLATVETIIKATLTVFSALLYPITDVPFNNLKDSTALAGRATIEAFKGVFGYSTQIEVESKKEIKTPTTPQKSWKEIALENKAKIALFVLGAAALCAAVYFRKDLLSSFTKMENPNVCFPNEKPQFDSSPQVCAVNSTYFSTVVSKPASPQVYKAALSDFSNVVSKLDNRTIYFDYQKPEPQLSSRFTPSFLQSENQSVWPCDL